MFKAMLYKEISNFSDTYLLLTMAGKRKSHKKVLNELSLIKYRSKMYNMYLPVVGKEYADTLSSILTNNYKENYVMLYSKVRNNPHMRMYLERTLGAALQFIAFQLINEFISSVILGKNKTASMLYEKYKYYGLSPDIIREIMVITVNILKDDLPDLAQSLGNVRVTPNNVLSLIDRYVNSRSF